MTKDDALEEELMIATAATTVRHDDEEVTMMIDTVFLALTMMHDDGDDA